MEHSTNGHREAWRDAPVARLWCGVCGLDRGCVDRRGLDRAASRNLVCRPRQAGLHAAERRLPIVWPILYALMALAAGRVASLPQGTPMRRRALIFYGAQLLLNVVWSFAFFTR